MGNNSVKLNNVVVTKGRNIMSLCVTGNIDSGSDVRFEVDSLRIDANKQYYFVMNDVKYVFEPFTTSFKGINIVLNGDQVKWYSDTMKPKFKSTITNQDVPFQNIEFEDESLL